MGRDSRHVVTATADRLPAGRLPTGYYRDVEDPIIAVRADGYGTKPGADLSAINPRARAALEKIIASNSA